MQISQIICIDKANLILLFMKLLPDISDLQTINMLYHAKKDSDVYDFLKKHNKKVDSDTRAACRAEIISNSLKFLKIKPGAKLLEIECGDGKITEELNKIMKFKNMITISNIMNQVIFYLSLIIILIW